ncbi:MAG: hypothetical protein SFV23_14105 [Planctomycetaceae bacterium]|nr:hypothetical protein [Planctomycetaceae bacterium]
MWTHLLSGFVLLAASTSFAAESSSEALAARCIHEVEQVVVRAANAAADETEQCVRTINALQDQGRDAAAEQVAADCLRAATGRARNAARFITRICNVCVETLIDRDEIELARRVNSACEDGIAALRQLLERETAAISEALAD